MFQLVAGVCAASSIALVLAVLTHRGSGAGLSDLLGGAAADAARSGTAGRNLMVATLALFGVWLATLVLLAVMSR